MSWSRERNEGMSLFNGWFATLISVLAIAVARASGFRWTKHEEIAAGIAAVIILLILYAIFRSDPASAPVDDDTRRLNEQRDYLLSRLEAYSDRCGDICVWLAGASFMHQQAIRDALDELDKAQGDDSG